MVFTPTLLWEPLFISTYNFRMLFWTGLGVDVGIYHTIAVPPEKIEESDWNLNVARYVDTTEPEPVDVANKRWLEEKRERINSELDRFLEELDYA